MSAKMTVLQQVFLRNQIVGVDYQTWYRFRDDKNPKYRRLALVAKIRGLRMLDKLEINFSGK